MPNTIGTLLSSTAFMSIPMVLYYLLLAHFLSLWYSSIFYWIPAYTYGIILSSNGSLPIPTVLYYRLLATWPTAYSTILYWLLPKLMILFYLLLAPCLYLWNSTTFYCLPAYTYDILQSFTGFMPIPMVFTTFYLIPTYIFGTLLSSTGYLHIPLVLFYLLLPSCLYL